MSRPTLYPPQDQRDWSFLFRQQQQQEEEDDPDIVLAKQLSMEERSKPIDLTLAEREDLAQQVIQSLSRSAIPDEKQPTQDDEISEISSSHNRRKNKKRSRNDPAPSASSSSSSSASAVPPSVKAILEALHDSQRNLRGATHQSVPSAAVRSTMEHQASNVRQAKRDAAERRRATQRQLLQSRRDRDETKDTPTQSSAAPRPQPAISIVSASPPSHGCHISFGNGFSIDSRGQESLSIVGGTVMVGDQKVAQLDQSVFGGSGVSMTRNRQSLVRPVSNFNGGAVTASSPAPSPFVQRIPLPSMAFINHATGRPMSSSRLSLDNGLVIESQGHPITITNGEISVGGRYVGDLDFYSRHLSGTPASIPDSFRPRSNIHPQSDVLPLSYPPFPPLPRLPRLPPMPPLPPFPRPVMQPSIQRGSGMVTNFINVAPAPAPSPPTASVYVSRSRMPKLSIPAEEDDAPMANKDATNACCVCQEKQATAMFDLCKHICLCVPCVHVLRSKARDPCDALLCPICRRPSYSIERVYPM